MNQFSRNAWLWVILIVMILFLYQAFEKPQGPSDTVPYSKFLQEVDQGRVEQLTIKKQKIKGTYKDSFGSKVEFETNMPESDDALVPKLVEKGVEFDVAPEEEESWFLVLMANWFPMIFLIAVWLFFMKQIQSGGGKALSFGKSRARMLEEGNTKVTFKDVAGIDESKSELEAIVSFLKDPKKYSRLGGRIPRGVLLVGSPGTGKTLLARAIAGEAGVPFFSISGSDFVEMFVGVGASRVRDLFVKGKKNAPCIIFIDEIDAVGRHRGAGLGGGHDEREQTLNQLLVEMDGFEENEGVILIAATNRPDVLDPALLRPGRFDRTVVVPLPDIKGRQGILAVHAAKVPLSKDVSLEILARGTPGFSGADLSNLVNEAALYAALRDSDEVNMKHFEFAKDKIMMGVERRSMILSDKEKEVSAWHEAGHAIIARLVPCADPVHKVTIVPRGVALGLMQQLPQDEKHTYSKEYCEDRICIAFGGRVAEELKFGQITTGASGDIGAVTKMARRMVCEWGMSEKLGLIAYGGHEGAPFLGRDMTHHSKDFSEDTARQIDDEVRAIVDVQLERARTILTENRAKLDDLAEALLVLETLDGEQVDKVIAGEFDLAKASAKEIAEGKAAEEKVAAGKAAADDRLAAAKKEEQAEKEQAVNAE